MSPSEPDLVASDMSVLEADLLQAHHNQDGAALARLYFAAGELSEQAGHTDEAGYRYTQAYVFALESGETALADRLRQKLIASGREE